MKFTLAALMLCVPLLGSCASTHDREIDALMATLPVAGIAGDAAGMAEVMRSWAGQATGVSDADKAPLLARAAVLEAHALSLSKSIGLFDETGRTRKGITLANLQARAAGLQTETHDCHRALNYWLVQHGLKAADEVYEVFDVTAALADGTHPS